MVLQVATYSFFYQGDTVVLLIRNTVKRCIEPSLSLQKNVTRHVRIFVCTFSIFAPRLGKPAECRPFVNTVGSQLAYNILKHLCLFGYLATACLLSRLNGVQSNGT
jgi:hypothetical protein